MNDIFRMKPEPANTRETIFYTIIGKQTGFDSDDNPILDLDGSDVLAKKIVTDTKTKYFIKVGPYGKIYNPIGIFSEGRSNKFLRQSGKPEWDFEEVNSKIFNLYLSFLRTKNIAHLNLAERELH